MKKFSIGDILKPTVVLTVICLITSALLAVTNMLTAPKIAELAVKTETEARQEVLSQAIEFSDEKFGDTAYCIGKDENGNTVGYVFTATSKGYGGEIKVTVGVDTEGKVTGVKILDISETPGLGMNADNADWLSQFIGKTLGINVNKNTPGDNEIQALTGATITSKAVTAAVNEALDYYSQVTGGAENG